MSNHRSSPDYSRAPQGRAIAPTVEEEESGTAQLSFFRLGSTSGDLEISYSVGGSADAGVDYTALSGTAIFADGENSVTIDVSPLSDMESEGLETVVITVEPGTGYTVGSRRYATVTIEDDEFVEPVVPLSYVVTVRPGETIDDLDFGSRIENNEPPFVEDILPNFFANEDGQNRVFDLFAAFGDLEDADADLTFTVSGNTNPDLFDSVIIDPVAGTLTLDYAANANGTTALTVRATDTGGQSVTQTFDFTLNPRNDTPDAASAVFGTPEGNVLDFDLRTLVDDVETADDDLVFNVSGAVNGSVELLPDGHTARFTPNENYNGPAAFDYDVTDTGDNGDPAITSGPVTIDVAVAAVNDVRILDISVNDGGDNRSNVRNIHIEFSDDTNIQELIDSGEIVDVIEIFGVTNSPMTEVHLTSDRFKWVDGSHTVTIDLTVDGYGGSDTTLLSNDNYELRIQTGEILSPNLVNAALLDTDGVDDGVFDFSFHRLLGDVDGNRIVTFDDVAKLLGAFGQENRDADTNGDGIVNILDFWSVYGSMGNGLPDEIFAQ